MKLNIVRQYLAYAVCAVLVLSCSEDEVGTSNAVADFSFAVDADDKQQISFTNESKGAEFYHWNFGDNTSSALESPVHKYESGGTYFVTLMAKTKAGSKVYTQQLDVEGNEVNLITNGDMASSGNWTSTGTGMSLTTTQFADGKLKFSNGTGSAQTNVVVWQAIQVETGKNYKFSAHVSGSGASNTWFELYFGKTQPADGADYTVGKYTELNTWGGCGNTAFDGNLAVIGCGSGPGTGQNGAITFDQTGTWYIAFKAGSWDGSLGTTGIVLDDVKLVEVE